MGFERASSCRSIDWAVSCAEESDPLEIRAETCGIRHWESEYGGSGKGEDGRIEAVTALDGIGDETCRLRREARLLDDVIARALCRSGISEPSRGLGREVKKSWIAGASCSGCSEGKGIPGWECSTVGTGVDPCEELDIPVGIVLHPWAISFTQSRLTSSRSRDSVQCNWAPLYPACGLLSRAQVHAGRSKAILSPTCAKSIGPWEGSLLVLVQCSHTFIFSVFECSWVVLQARLLCIVICHWTSARSRFVRFLRICPCTRPDPRFMDGRRWLGCVEGGVGKRMGGGEGSWCRLLGASKSRSSEYGARRRVGVG